MLVFAVIALAFPSNPRSYGTDLMGFWIVLIFGYVGVARLVPVMFFSIIFISALLYFVAGIGFFWGRPYAWILGIALACFGIASSMIQLVVWPIDYWLFVSPGLFSTSFILYYLTRSDVRNFFGGKGPHNTSGLCVTEIWTMEIVITPSPLEMPYGKGSKDLPRQKASLRLS